MNYLFSLALGLVLFAPFAARADVAPEPGFHKFTVCAYIDNLGEYPEFDVYATNNWRFGPTPVLARGSLATDPDVCGGQNSSTPFFAVEDKNQVNIVHQDDPNQEQGDIWNTLSANQRYLITAEATGTPDEINLWGTLPDSNKTYSFVTVYHIDSLSDAGFAVSLISEARYDDEGELLSQTTNQVTPPEGTQAPTDVGADEVEEPEQSTGSLLMLGAIVALGAALLVMALKSAWKK